jgi:hypothetical protein
MKSMDFFVREGRSRKCERQAAARAESAGGVNSRLFTTSATRPGGKRRDFTSRYGLGLVSDARNFHRVNDEQAVGRTSSTRRRDRCAALPIGASRAGLFADCNNIIQQIYVWYGYSKFTF